MVLEVWGSIAKARTDGWPDRSLGQPLGPRSGRRRALTALQVPPPSGLLKMPSRAAPAKTVVVTRGATDRALRTGSARPALAAAPPAPLSITLTTPPSEGAPYPG